MLLFCVLCWIQSRTNLFQETAEDAIIQQIGLIVNAFYPDFGIISTLVSVCLSCVQVR
jgi:hypothetical protein